MTFFKKLISSRKIAILGLMSPNTDKGIVHNNQNDLVPELASRESRRAFYESMTLLVVVHLAGLSLISQRQRHICLSCS
jgi:hypothetical protein